jgi:Holliday junction resolvase
MGARSRRKGAQAERDLAKRFAEAMPGESVKRGLGQARSAHEVADVDCPVFWIESKRQRRANVRAALEQAEAAVEAAESFKVPLAVIHDDREEPFVVMRLDAFLDIVRTWWPAKKAGVDRFMATGFDGLLRCRYDEMDDAEAKCAAAIDLGDRDDS